MSKDNQQNQKQSKTCQTATFLNVKYAGCNTKKVIIFTFICITICKKSNFILRNFAFIIIIVILTYSTEEAHAIFLIHTCIGCNPCSEASAVSN